MNIPARKVVTIGKGERVYGIGDGYVTIQSMLNCRSDDVAGNVAQAVSLERAGCEIIRVSIPSKADAVLIDAIKKNVSVPVVADIHFDKNAALAAVCAGADKIRVNPGNLSETARREVAAACRNAGIPIRVGVNSGSIEKSVFAELGRTPRALVKSALDSALLLEQCDFSDIVIAVKSSDVRETIAAYRLLAEQTAYPLHVGVTEAGTPRMGVIKSAVGLGSLLCDGIGDTLRVSLTGDPVSEVAAGFDILRAVGLRGGYDVVSCPTCGRTRVDVASVADEVDARLAQFAGLTPKKRFRVAVMGCAVNGIGEGKDADFGIAFGGVNAGSDAVIFARGEIIRRCDASRAVDVLFEQIAV